ncbi:glutamate racemase [Glaciimonas sp. Gout2]|uniref:glutamate racemase n=2 Tax=Glaciimonas TaxID=1229970 RepID=UPI002AB431A1|nr:MULTISPECIES: glutamate racemase [unclassified Glaciimonas]MDY7547370.1 glutamate racemase [Glaciimonas sp. CA11.2]MEB0012599.1 glutamate racemase [Glaciimonas sp. Cout2]MEB0083950.1 glutamate racemase [Glaciimonas sp. Gout2]
MMTPRMPMEKERPIGIFDSGIGGLSVLRHIRDAMPSENLLYFADSAHAPYGDKTEQAILERSLSIAEFLLEQNAKAIVVACNTATAAAIKAIRSAYPTLAVVGIEPGLKPAALQTTTKKIGVLATKGTLSSASFNMLSQKISAATGVQFTLQACVGLADQIEKGELDTETTDSMIFRYVAPLIEQNVDTLVLGCTHYPFVRPMIEKIVKRLTSTQVALIDTSDAVTKQLIRILAEYDLGQTNPECGSLTAFTTGKPTVLKNTFFSLLGWQPRVFQVPTVP